MPKFRARSANLQVGVSDDGKRALARFDRGALTTDEATAKKLRAHRGFGRDFVEIDEGRESSAAGDAAKTGAAKRKGSGKKGSGKKGSGKKPATDGGAGTEAGG